MRCPHCGEDHPNTAKYCMNTGKKIESSMDFVMCQNPDCNYRQPLPSNTNFCPNCGFELTSSNPFQRQRQNRERILAIKVGYDEFKFCDSKGVLLSEKAYEGISYAEDDKPYQPFVVHDRSNVFYVTPNGEFIVIGDYDEDGIYKVVRNFTEECIYVLVVIHRNAKLYKIDKRNNISRLGEFRFKQDDEDFVFQVIDNYVTLLTEDDIQSINYNTRKRLTIEGYQYSAVVGKNDGKPVCIAINQRKKNGNDFDLISIDGRFISAIQSCVIVIPSESEQYCYVVKLNNDNEGRVGIINTNGDTILPSKYYGLTFKDTNQIFLVDSSYPAIIYDIDNKSILGMRNNGDDEHNIIIHDTPPTNYEEYREFEGKYEFGFGISSLFAHIGNEISERKNNRFILTMNENEYPIGANDLNNRFGIYDPEYLTIYDKRGTVIKEFHYRNGICNPRMYQSGVIVLFDNYLEEVRIISNQLNETKLKSDDFDGTFGIINGEYIVIGSYAPNGDKQWKIYDQNGESVLPSEIVIYNYKVIDDDVVIIDNTGHDGSNNYLLDLRSMSYYPIQIENDSLYYNELEVIAVK